MIYDLVVRYELLTDGLSRRYTNIFYSWFQEDDAGARLMQAHTRLNYWADPGYLSGERDRFLSRRQRHPSYI